MVPLPQWLARFNRVATNRLGRPIAGWAPGFAIVRHVGRRSGRVYETPVAVFRRGDTVTIALTYGARSEWVKNVLAAGGCELRTRGKTLRLIDPRVVRDDRRRGVPAVVRVVLRVMGVAEFLVSRYELQLAKSP